MMDKNKLEKAVLGGGCFWCLDALYREVRGVVEVKSGYAGGKIKHPTYEQVGHGDTGHAEVVQITFDPNAVSYQDLLEIFFTTHNPTTPNRQGNDVGPQYRSIILYGDDAQKQTAEQVIREFVPTIWDEPIVTELSPLDKFYEAEGYHQDYFKKNPQAAYCQIIINPKLAKFREKFSSLLKE